MFSYYGTKKRLAKEYPVPKYDILIEPFAGAGAYSLYGDNWKKNVKLYDTNPKIYKTWKYLLNAEKSDILNLPDLKTGDKVTDFDLSEAEKYLIGYCINPGSSNPKITASKRSSWNRYKLNIAENLYKIKHWEVFNTSYETIPNCKATWYIDPPYQKAGKYYFGYKQMDYKYLRNWCIERLGQVIVCENEGADWLPFDFLTKHQGSIQNNTEVIYYQDD